MNTEKMKKFNTLSTDDLAIIDGGEGGWYMPILPNYGQLLSSICGLADGLKGRKHKGSC
ncbi:ComC/BlpC family leader-containing pheromone/bacteriocin [Streptococcus phocae subsp. salmonis]|uniref:ComC/BlpC family leader-containing pheromone/bacteriocin n=1 Tax=Streptococcus phocae TaxID=119224 RepID=UPI000A988796|nr:ComC/BlpC family leader-containing pheromone/bacteriocin [Streptococcus phocae]